MSKEYCKKCGHELHTAIDAISFREYTACDICDFLANTEWFKRREANNPEKLKWILEKREISLEKLKKQFPKQK